MGMFDRFTQNPHLPGALLFLCSAGPLGLALLSQYGFGLHPCELCIWQRYPYGVLISLAILALLLSRWLRVLMIISGGVWAVEAALAFYHAGVEQHWWRSATGCSASGVAASLEALKAQIMGAPLVACDMPEFVLLGLSMAGWNALYSLAMVLFIAYVLRQTSPCIVR